MRRFVSGVLFSLVLALATTAGHAVADSEKPLVCAVNYPLAWAAQQLAGEFVEVSFAAPAGVDPALWWPRVEDVSRCQQADLILLNGAGYARWVRRVSLPQNRVLDTSRAFSDRLIQSGSGPVHSHGPEGEHSHGETAGIVWLDLDLYGQQVEAVAAALGKLLPDEAAAIGQGEAAILLQLAELDERLLQLGQSLDGAPVLFSHPVYQYLERRYGLTGYSKHWEPGQHPAPTEWSELAAFRKDYPASSMLMLWEDEPLPETRERLAALGVQVVVFRPMGNRPPQGDFLQGMADNIASLTSAIEQLQD